MLLVIICIADMMRGVADTMQGAANGMHESELVTDPPYGKNSGEERGKIAACQP